jgi:hypothetical protein
MRARTYTWDWFATLAVALVASTVVGGAFWQRSVVILAVWAARLLARVRRNRADELRAFADFYVSNYSERRK